MNEAPEILRQKFIQLIGWEKRKRRQEILATLMCYSLLAALLLMPICFLLPASFLRWFIPLPIFLTLAPFSFVAHRWRREDSARACPSTRRSSIRTRRCRSTPCRGLRR